MNWASFSMWFSQHGGRLLLILVLGGILYLLLRRIVPPLIKTAVVKGMQGQPEEEIQQRVNTLAFAIVSTGSIIISIGVLFTALSEVGLNITPALAGLGIAGIAVGFGAQNLVRDLMSGALILLENQFAVGDVVKIANVAGLVEEINLRRTVLRDLDGVVHIVPNGEIRIASNYTKLYSRVNLNILVDYKEDLDRVVEVVNEVGKEMAQDHYWGSLILTPPQVLRVDAFEDSGIAIKIVGDTKPIKQWDVAGELRKRLKKAFDNAGIEIPYPHMRVYFGNFPPRPSSSGTPG